MLKLVQRQIINDDLFLTFDQGYQNDLFLEKVKNYLNSDLDLNLVVDISAFAEVNIFLLMLIINSYFLRIKKRKRTIIYTNAKIAEFLNLAYISQFIDVLIKR